MVLKFFTLSLTFSFANAYLFQINAGDRHWPENPWEIYDFVMGFLIGGYPILIARAYASDCFSMFFILGTFQTTKSSYFDSKWSNTAFSYLTLVVIITADVLKTYDAYNSCTKQLFWMKLNSHTEQKPWIPTFDF